MSDKLQTRGRPKKKNDEKLPSISRKLFSQHCAVFYACCMVYVLQTFLKTKQQKRIGHSEGGFTIYEKISEVYSFQNFESDVKQWGYNDVFLANPGMIDFARTVNGCAPKFVFKELVCLMVQIINFFQQQNIDSIQCLEQNQYKLWSVPENDLNKMYKYIRFVPSALKQIKMEKWNQQISQKIKELWKPFIKIISYTIFCVIKDIQKNKYLKPFFSDAEHPEETIIGQLNLEQIIEQKYLKSFQFQKEPKNEYDEDYQCYTPTQNKIQICSNNSLRRSNLRPITLITHPSVEKSQGKIINNSAFINRNLSQSIQYKINSEDKAKEINEYNQNASIELNLQNFTEKEKDQKNKFNQDEDFYSKIIIQALKSQQNKQYKECDQSDSNSQEEFQHQLIENNHFFGVSHKKIKKNQN